MSGSDLQMLTAIGETPISESTPCGENVRYESVFEELEAELAKQESLSSETVDWQRVADLSTKILQESSKDLLVGAYLTQALLINEGYSGLAVGLKILNDMVEKHWDCLFPPAKRIRARATAITWLAERAGNFIADKVPTANDAEAVVEAAKYIRALDVELADKMGDAAPLVTDLSRPLKNYKKSAEAEISQATAPSTEHTPQAATSEAAAVTNEALENTTPAAGSVPVIKNKPPKATASSQVIGDIATDNDAKKLLKQAQESARKVATYWFTKKLSDAKAYRVARASTWIQIEAAPPATDGITQVMPPTADRIKFFTSQIEKAEYAAVLPELEKTLARATFWLDGHNMVVGIFRSLGAEYDKAADAVISELRHFLQRVPELTSLSFSDQTPFASDQTKMWIESEVLLAVGVSNSAAVSGGSDNSWDTALAEARKQAAGGNKEAAMTIFNDGIATAAQVRDQFYWRCALAELLLQTGEAKAASNLLKPMLQQVENYRLTEWEPDLLSKIYKLLYQSYRKQQGKKKEDAGINEMVDSTYGMLCWFDPVTALTVKGEK